MEYPTGPDRVEGRGDEPGNVVPHARGQARRAVRPGDLQHLRDAEGVHHHPLPPRGLGRRQRSYTTCCILKQDPMYYKLYTKY